MSSYHPDSQFGEILGKRAQYLARAGRGVGAAQSVDKSKIEIGLQRWAAGAVDSEFKVVEATNNPARTGAQAVWPIGFGDILTGPREQGAARETAYRRHRRGRVQQLLPAIRTKGGKLYAKRPPNPVVQIQPERDPRAVRTCHAQNRIQCGGFTGPGESEKQSRNLLWLQSREERMRG